MLSTSDLWARHGDNRILFPNLVMLSLADLVHLNTVVEQYVSGVLLAAATGLITWAHKRRSPSIGWLWYVPAALLLMSFVQYQDTLWGFQLAWYMVYFTAAASLFVLDRPKLTWLGLGVAVILAVVCSYSSIQGLLIWPVGMLLLYQRNRTPRLILTWLGCAVVAGGVYFYNLSPAGGFSSYVFTHPILGTKYFLLSIGDVLGLGVPSQPDAGRDLLMAFGLVVFLLACWVLFSFGRHRDETSGVPFGVAVTAYGLAFAALETAYRASQGLAVAATSRYTTFDLLIPVGCYLTLLSARALSRQETASGVTPQVWQRNSLRVVAVVLAVVIGLQVTVGTVTGIVQARNWYLGQRIAANVTVNGTKESSPYEQYILLANCNCPIGIVLPHLIQVAREHHLSVFGTGDAPTYAKEGLPPETVPPTTRVLRPSSGTRLRGGLYLAATVTDNYYEVTDVEFVLTGEGFHESKIATAQNAGYFWIAGWKSATVPDGSYLLQSIAYDATGNSVRSPSVRIQVANR
jgi:hypothetical protein